MRFTTSLCLSGLEGDEKGKVTHSICICYEGGLNARGRPADTRTPAQKESLVEVLSALKERFPKAKLHAMVGAMTVVA